MASIFGKDPSKQPPPDSYARTRIEQEIGHLKKPQSTRSLKEDRTTLTAFIIFAVVIAVVGLYVMDPFLFAWHKGDAVKAYLYLRSYGSGDKAQDLASCGVFTEADLDVLNRRQGSFQEYFATAEDAKKTADSVITYMSGLSKVRHGPYEELDPLGKVRYSLFCRWGIMPPTDWSFLDPQISDN